ncbi:hypothetical protein KIN20_036616 [Parelaphostrongylus tenuis]|uniref:Uncharacterized protein n=1 Tax=Parelaphostrongylus tenuis TaxID=148309 RepID=A0AAD5RDD9_PARTN|nr:hypothetical protein KIN20_036616 [Parelaphostrongylus tenuis]
MRSTRGSNPTIVGRVSSIRQRDSGVDGRKTEGSKAAKVCEQMRSTRRWNPNLVGRVASVRQRHNGVDDKNPGGERKASKAATVCEQMRSTRRSSRLSSEEWRPSDNGTV